MLKTTRLRTAFGSKQTKNHICRGEDNIEVRIIQGEESWIDDHFEFAHAFGREYAVRHLIVAPEVKGTTIEQMVDEARNCANEFGLDFGGAFIAAHHKDRVRDDACEWHLHVLFRDYDRDGKASDNRNNYKRQEKLAREAEHRLGHPYVNGAHTRWVIRQLLKENKTDIAAALRAAFPENGKRAKASLDPTTIQKLKRLGYSASALRQHVRDDWHGSATADDFLARASAHGLSIICGERDPPSWIVTVKETGDFLCSLAGALKGVSTSTINERLGEPQNGNKQGQQLDLIEHIAATAAVASSRADHGASAPDAGNPSSADRDGSKQQREQQPAGPVARTDDGRSSPADRESAENRTGAVGSGDWVHQGSAGIEIGTQHGFTVVDRVALLRCRPALAEALANARRAAELPFDRITRVLADMEATALADQITAHVPISPAQVEAYAKQKQLDERRNQTRKELAAIEEKLAALVKLTPSWSDRLTGSHAAAVALLTETRDTAKSTDDGAKAECDRQKKWTSLLDQGQAMKVATAAPIAENAARNLKIVQHARAMLTTEPRGALIGPWAFIAQAAIRAGLGTPYGEIEGEKKDDLPMGDLLNRVNQWGIPLT